MLEMAPVEDQQPVEAFRADGSNEPLGDRVRLRCAHRRRDDPDAVAAEDLVEGAAVLRVASRIRNRRPSSEKSGPRLRACCVTHSPAGFVMQPAILT
jgi:hypothetical protein